MKILDKSIKLAYELFPNLYSNRTRPQSWHFTFLYKRSHLISIGTNDYGLDGRVYYLANKYDIIHRKRWPSRHSEFSAISKCWGRYYLDSSIKLVNIRLNIKGELLNSKPCLSCEELLRSIGIYKVWYSKDNTIIKGF